MCLPQDRLFDSMVTRCIVQSRDACEYSRCGRTDKGVSAFSQILALRVRSQARKAGFTDKKGNILVTEDEVCCAMRCSWHCQWKFIITFCLPSLQPLPPPPLEIDYPIVINSGLPDDIRVLGWCDLPASFSARFSAKHRTYRYFFPKRDLDVGLMREAAAHYIGRHDFRNICKIDIMNVKSFER